VLLLPPFLGLPDGLLPLSLGLFFLLLVVLIATLAAYRSCNTKKDTRY